MEVTDGLDPAQVATSVLDRDVFHAGTAVLEVRHVQRLDAGDVNVGYQVS